MHSASNQTGYVAICAQNEVVGWPSFPQNYRVIWKRVTAVSPVHTIERLLETEEQLVDVIAGTSFNNKMGQIYESWCLIPTRDKEI